MYLIFIFCEDILNRVIILRQHLDLVNTRSYPHYEVPYIYFILVYSPTELLKV